MMADDTTDEAEMDNDDESLTVSEAFEFFAERTEREGEKFSEEEGTEVPQHAEAIVADKATDLLKTVTSVDMAYVMADEGEEVARDEMDDALEEAVVDLLAAVGSLKHERDIDIGEAVAERIEFIEAYQTLEEKMQAAETEEETMEVMDEYLTDELAAELGMQMPSERGPTVGSNVDDDEYDPQSVGKAFQ